MKEIKRVKVNDFDWEAFDKGKIAIKVDNEDPKELDEVLSILNKRGYTWIFTPGKITDKNSYTYKSLRSERYPFYLSVGGFKPYCCKGIVWSGCWTTIHETPVRIDFKEDKNMPTFEKVNVKDFDWKRFSDDRVAIVVDNRYKADLDKVMKLLNDAGYYWAGTNTPLSAKHAQGYKAIIDGLHRHITYLSTSGREHDHAVYWSEGCSGREHPVKIIFDERTNDGKIVITNDGKTTTATLYSNGKKASIGTAVCHDDDKFDIYAGAKLALERLERYKKEAEMSDWEKFVKGKVNMRVPKKYVQNFLGMATWRGLTFKGTMSDWYLRWLVQEGDSIVVCVNSKIEKVPILTEVLHDDNGETVDYIPEME